MSLSLLSWVSNFRLLTSVSWRFLEQSVPSGQSLRRVELSSVVERCSDQLESLKWVCSIFWNVQTKRSTSTAQKKKKCRYRVINLCARSFLIQSFYQWSSWIWVGLNNQAFNWNFEIPLDFIMGFLYEILCEFLYRFLLRFLKDSSRDFSFFSRYFQIYLLGFLPRFV